MDGGIMAWFGHLEVWFAGCVAWDAYLDDAGRIVDFRKI